jgi:hypothetical protein
MAAPTSAQHTGGAGSGVGAAPTVASSPAAAAAAVATLSDPSVAAAQRRRREMEVLRRRWAEALPTKPVGHASAASVRAQAPALTPGWLRLSVPKLPGQEVGGAGGTGVSSAEWRLCWQGGCAGLLELSYRRRARESGGEGAGADVPPPPLLLSATWVLTLSGGGAACCHAVGQPPRPLASMGGAEVVQLTAAAARWRSLNALRCLARFGGWESLRPLLLALEQQERARVAAKRAAAKLPPLPPPPPRRRGGAEQWAEHQALEAAEQQALSMLEMDERGWELASPWVAQCGPPSAPLDAAPRPTMLAFLFELTQLEAPLPVLRVAARIATIATPELLEQQGQVRRHAPLRPSLLSGRAD